MAAIEMELPRAGLMMPGAVGTSVQSPQMQPPLPFVMAMIAITLVPTIAD